MYLVGHQAYPESDVYNMRNIYDILQEQGMKDTELLGELLVHEYHSQGKRPVSVDYDAYYRCDEEYVELVRNIVNRLTDVNAVDCTGQTPLHLAVKYNHRAMVQYLIGNGALVNAADQKGRTALHQAGSRRNYEITRCLLEGGADPRLRTHDGYSALYFAIQSGCTEIVELLLERGCDANEVVVDSEMNKSYTHLHRAVETNQVSMVATLLKSNADPNQRDCYGGTSLHWASRFGQYDCARLLLEHGALIHERDHNELTAVYLAVESEHREVFDLLVRHGANPNDRGEAGASLLHLAVSNREPDFVQLLLSSGADANATTRFGHTPLHYAIVQRNWRALELLLRHGADLDRRERQGKTALHLAVEARCEEAVGLLLRHGASADVPDENRRTALHSAAKQGCVATVRALLRLGSADANAKDAAGLTPLHVAARHGFTELLQPLLEHGVDLDSVDEHGITALHLAVVGEQSKLAYVLPERTFFARLLERGADVNRRTLASGETALHVAVRTRCAAFARCLLRRGADADLPEWTSSRVPLRLALENDDAECLEQLLNYGADVRGLLEAGPGPGPALLAERPNAARVLARYLARRRAAGLGAAEGVGPLGAGELEDYEAECAKEVRAMAMTRMFEEVTLLDFLRAGRRGLAAFVKRPEVRAMFEEPRHCRAAFPIYADMLERNLELGARYEPVLGPAAERLDAALQGRLSSVPLERVLGYLDERDMRNVIKAIPELPVA